MVSEHDESRRRWMAKRGVALVLDVLRGEVMLGPFVKTTRWSK